MDTLNDYVTGRLQAGRSRADIRDELVAVGWSEEAAESAYRSGLIALGAPVPDKDSRSPSSPRVAAGDVAANLFALILLGIMIGAALLLFFELVNRAFPDPAETFSPLASMHTIQHATASLAVAFPLYVLAMRRWLSRFNGEQERVEGRLTQWLTYVVLLLAAVTMVCDLIALVSALLQGEMSLRLLLKAGAVFGIAALVLGFYLLERRLVHERRHVEPRLFKGLLGLAGALLAAGMAAGLLVAGSPQQARALMLDEQRSNRLSALSGCITRYAEQYGQLPASLEQLAKTSQFDTCNSTDPETGQRYGYRVVSTASESSPDAGFELCATFARDTQALLRAAPGEVRDWNEHGSGRQCWLRYARATGKGTDPAR